MSKTPEQRAAEIVAEIEDDADFYCDGRVSQTAADENRQHARELIASAIRDAEHESRGVLEQEQSEPSKSYFGLTLGVTAELARDPTLFEKVIDDTLAKARVKFMNFAADVRLS